MIQGWHLLRKKRETLVAHLLPQQPLFLPSVACLSRIYFSLCLERRTGYLPAGLNSYTPSTRSTFRFVTLPGPVVAPGWRQAYSQVALIAIISVTQKKSQLTKSSMLYKHRPIDYDMWYQNFLLTLCQLTKDVFNIVSICSRRLHMLNALASCKVVRFVLLHSLIYYVAFVSCQNDRCLFSNLMDQLFVPSRGSLE